jgi:FixJ family two-component response regulator
LFCAYDSGIGGVVMNDVTQQTVYIIDDEDDLRDALSMLMRAVGLRVATFASARDFLQNIQQRESGCLVLDIRMPGMSGIELQAELHKRRVRLPIVFLTGHGDVPLAVQAMKAGAVDFIQKPLDEHRLVVAVMNALKSNGDHNTLTEPASGVTATPSEKLALLSRRERDVLDHLVNGKASRELAILLSISIKTVEFHRANIREKLGVSNLPELLRLVLTQ